MVKRQTKVIPFEKATRQQRRHSIVKIKLPNGRWLEMDAIAYLKRAATELPLMYNQKTGKRLDHYRMLHDIYLDGGLPEVKRYVKKVFTIIRKEEKKRCKFAKKEARKKVPLWRKILHVFE